MKVLMISDASSAGAEDAAALGEVRHALESEAHDVDIVRISPTTFSGDLETEAVALLQGADVVVFGNGDQASKGFVEKVLLLSEGLHAERDALQADNDSLRASNEGLTRDNADLRAGNDALTKDNADLRAGNDVLTKDNADLRAGNDALTKDNADLRAGNDALTKDNADLRAGNDELTRSNASLQASNDTYVRINSSLQESNDELTRDNIDLRASNDSLERDNASLRESNTGLTQDNDDLMADNDTLRHDSREDALTHILNRRGFNQDWPKFMLAHPTFILISVDINDFKLFNDLYGHHIGDQLLMALADEFRDLLPEGDIVARSGGDEFVLLIADPTDEWMQEASDFFNRVHSFEFEGVPYTYMLSGGFAAYPEQTESFPALLRMADSALYHAKMLAKDKFFKYSADMDNDVRVSLGFNARSLASTAPAAILIFKASGDHKILFANALCAELLGFSSVSELMGTAHSLAHVVCPGDLALLDQHLADQAAQPASPNPVSTACRVLDKGGTPHTVVAMARKSHNEHFGDIFHAFLFDPETLGRDLEAIGV